MSAGARIARTVIIANLFLCGQPSSALVIDQVPELIKANNGDSQAARRDLEISETEVHTAKERLFPEIKIKNTYIHLPEELTLKVPAQTFTGGLGSVTVDLAPIKIQTVDFWTSHLVATQPLYAGGRIMAGIEASQAKTEESRAIVERTDLEKTSEALNRYFGRQYAHQVVRTLNGIAKKLDRLLEISESLVKSGLAAKFATLQIKVSRAELNSRLAEATGKESLADLAFRASVGLNAAEKFAYESPLLKLPLPNKTSVQIKKIAQQRRAEFRILKSKLQQIDSLKQVALGEALPVVYAFGSAEIASSFRSWITPQWFVGVGLDIPLSGWVGAVTDRHRASLMQAKVEALQKKAHSEIPLQVEKLFVELNAIEASYKATEERIGMAQEALRLAEVRFKRGDGSTVELLMSSTEAEKADLQRLQLTEEFNRKIIELYVASGDLATYFEDYKSSPRTPNSVEPE